MIWHLRTYYSKGLALTICGTWHSAKAHRGSCFTTCGRWWRLWVRNWGGSDAVLRRILNHTAPRTDVLNRHYVGWTRDDVSKGLQRIQAELNTLMGR